MRPDEQRWDALHHPFTSPDGEALIPGYYVPIGIGNFERFFGSPALRGPLTIVFIWTILHALGTVFITFVLGLGMALLLGAAIPAAATETIDIAIGHQSMCTDTYTGGIVIKEQKLLEKHLARDGKYTGPPSLVQFRNIRIKELK